MHGGDAQQISGDIARMIDHDAAVELWDRYKRGERNVFSRRLYTLQGEPYNPSCEDFGGHYTLTTKDGTVYQIDGQTGITINTAGGNLELKSNAQTKINGTQTSIQGTATAELKSGGGGKVVVVGPQVMLN